MRTRKIWNNWTTTLSLRYDLKGVFAKNEKGYRLTAINCDGDGGDRC